MGRPKGIRSANKTLRLTPRAKFSVEVFAPLLGQSGNAYISTCVEAHAPAMQKRFGVDFKTIWHSEQAVRDLRLLLLSDEYPFDEKQKAERTFVLLHREFFYDKRGNELVVNERRALELYPRLNEWRSTKGDHWAAGRAMAEHLRSRGMSAPEWPPKDAS